MQVFWATFQQAANPSPLNLGAGVTARSESDARAIVEAAFDGAMLVNLRPVEDVSTLEAGHVRPNMGDIFVRGIWFPLGYEQVASRVR